MKQKEISPVRLLLRWAGPEKKWLIGSVLCAFGSGLLAITAYLGLYRLMDAVLSGACTPAVIADCAVFVMAGTVGRMVLLGASGVLSHKGAYGSYYALEVEANPDFVLDDGHGASGEGAPGRVGRAEHGSGQDRAQRGH